MKKILLCIMLSSITTLSYASVLIKLNGVDSGKNVFITSLDDGKRYEAVSAGSFAIVSDNLLKNNSQQYTVGVSGYSTVAYCVDANSSNSQFTFSYNKKDTTNKVVSLEKTKKAYVCKVLS